MVTVQAENGLKPIPSFLPWKKPNPKSLCWQTAPAPTPKKKLIPLMVSEYCVMGKIGLQGFKAM